MYVKEAKIPHWFSRSGGFVKVLSYSVFAFVEVGEKAIITNDPLNNYLLSRGYKLLSVNSESAAVFAYLGQENQVMAKVDSDVVGANYLKKRLLRLMKKVMQAHQLSYRIILMISPADKTVVYVPKSKKISA
jgi:hypothetical protein